MSIANSRAWIAGNKNHFHRVVLLSLCIVGFIPLFGQTASMEPAMSKARPARAGVAAPSSRPITVLIPGQSEEALQKVESARIARLSEIARAINEPRTDSAVLTTEAARLCGFSIWREDRSKIADPNGAPALKLAVTDTEIREYTEMFRAGHSVALSDLIGAMDVLFKGIGGQGSVGPHLMLWLQTGVRSENASVRALTTFLQDLGAFRPGAASGNFSGDTEKLDPIQSLFILRVLTEDMGVPLRRALAKIKPVSPFAESQALNSRPPLWTGIAVGTENAIAGGPRASFESPPQESEAPGWAEDSYAGGVTGLYGAVSDVMGLGEKAFGRYASGVGKSNAILSIVKFIATYSFLRGEMRVEAPGQPLIRTKDTRPGDGVRTVVARFFIDGTRVTDWMKDHRQLVVLAGLDLDMPKTGALKGVRTEWFVHQSTDPRRQIIQPLDWQGSLYKIMTNENGEASVKFTGNRQEKNLDPSKVMPVERIVKITVTPQVKATEMKQDLVDAVFGAIGIKDGPAGFVTPLMETLYRMNWTGETSLDLRVRDWQLVEAVGQLTVEIKAIGHEFRRGYALQKSIDRSLVIENDEMEVSGGEKPQPVDPELLKTLPPEIRAQIEESAKMEAEMAKKRSFYSSGKPEKIRMSINDRMTVLETHWDSDGERTSELSELQTWTGSHQSDISALPETRFNHGDFIVEIDLVKKTATVRVSANIDVNKIWDTQRVYFPTSRRPNPSKGTQEHRPSEYGMYIFHDLDLQAPFRKRSPGSEEVIIVLPLKEEPVIDGGGAMNYYGSVPIPFTFGRYVHNHEFKGTALLSYSVTRKVVKPK